MPDPIKIRATANGEFLDIRVMMPHPMESGQRRDGETRALIPAHYIERASITLNGKQVIAAELGPGVAKNPVLAFRLRGGKAGDKVVVSWQDNKGEKRSDEATVGDGSRN